MEYTRSLWKEKYLRLDFTFEGRAAVLIMPEQGRQTGRWLLKTEYFSAFQDMEERLVARGFCLVWLENINRWGIDADLDAKERLRDFLVAEFGLSRRCVPVGMSCGGLHAIKQAARHPEMIEALYLDAPVVNLFSCPMGFGCGTDIDVSAQEEMLRALSLTRSELLAYRDHPLDNIARLIENRIPLVLVWGDSDTTVPFCENGALVRAAYEQTDIPTLYIEKKNCGHHPHGPIDTRAVEAFLDKIG